MQTPSADTGIKGESMSVELEACWLRQNTMILAHT